MSNVSNDFLNTSQLKNDILTYFNINEAISPKKNVVDFMCLASNTYSTISEIFEYEKKKGGNPDFVSFMENVLTAFVRDGNFPYFCELALVYYPNLFNTAVKALLRDGEFFEGFELQEPPMIHAGIVKIPVGDNWKQLNIATTSEKNGYLKSFAGEQMFRDFASVQYEFLGPAVLSTGNTDWNLVPGKYRFYFAKDWLVIELC